MKPKAKFSSSIANAFNGILWAIKNERNIRIQTTVGSIVLVVSGILSLNLIEWIVILLCITAVISLEIINTAIENISDFICQELNSKIKIIKDLAAGAVLLVSISSVIIGFVLLTPKIINQASNFIN